jgi:hypothetical protein
MLDDLHTLRARDPHQVLVSLRHLPDADLTPDGVLPGPHSATFAGSFALLEPLLAHWFGTPTAGGTHFEVGGGVGEELPAGVGRVRIGDAERAEVDVSVADEALTPFHVVRYLAFATGRGASVSDLIGACRAVATRVAPEVPTAENPAKGLAWALWNRVPLLLSSPAAVPAQWLAQAAFARLGKTLAVPSGPHPRLLAATAFESRHALGDDLVGLWLGSPGGALALIDEVLATRVAQLECIAPEGSAAGGWLPSPCGDPVVDSLVLWYAASWVATYGALLAELDPGEERVYRALAVQE